MQSSSTRPSASTRHKGKEIAKPVTPQSESVSEEDSDPEQARRDKDMKKNLAHLANTSEAVQTIPTPTYELLQTPETRLKDTTPKLRQADVRLEDTDEEIDEQDWNT
ncbi:hypothetical protein Tco_0562308 [Tanacetum coccineum]